MVECGTKILSRNDRAGKSELFVFLIIFALAFARWCYYGFEYFHQLDDYIQYHNYAPPGGATPLATIRNLGLLSARPLAGVVDVFVWARLFRVMILAVAALSAMLAAAACLLRRVWARHFGTGSAFLVIFALLPLGIEGTYWVSASSRIVTGLFFAALSLYNFDRWCDTGRRHALVGYILAQAVSYGFYEQAIAFSLTATMIVAALHFKHNRRRAMWALFSLANLAGTAALAGMTGDSIVYGTRAGIILPFGADYWRDTAPAVWGQIRTAFLGGGFYTLVRGADRGAQILFADGNIIYMLVILTLCAALFWLARMRTEDIAVKKVGMAIAVGAALTIAPAALFFVIPNPWFSLRGTVMSLPGIALIADTVLRLVLSRIKHAQTVTAGLVSALALVFCVASISTLHDYRLTTLKDREIVALLASRLEENERLNPALKIAVLNVEPSYLKEQNFRHHEHIHGVTESAWALTGALEAHVGIHLRPEVTPLPDGVMYKPWNASASRLSNFDYIYIYLDGEIVETAAVKSGSGEMLLYDTHGEYIARVWERDNHGYLELAER